MIAQSSIAQQLTSILNPSAICSWEELEATQQKTILNVTENTNPSCIIYPNTQEELGEIITCVHKNRWRVLTCGNNSKLTWGGLTKNIDLIISTQRLNRIVEHAVGDLTLTVEAGTKFADIQELVGKEKQFLALDPAYHQTATIGGIVATADAGSLRQRFGGVRDMLLGISFVRYDGKIAKAGGRVVKNVAGYDLMKLFTGSFGTLGIISQVTFRLYPMSEASQTVALIGAADSIAEANKILLASALTPIAIDLLSTALVNRLELGKGIGLITRFQSVSESVKEQSNRLLEVGEKLGLQGRVFSDNDEINLWQRLQNSMWEVDMELAIACKIGVLPTKAINTLTQLDNLAPESMGLIHASSGVGLLKFDSSKLSSETILKMRNFCQSNNGYLTVLEAPLPWKKQLDIWGYSGNALDVMRKIKQQFDPDNIFSPHRFVAGI
ncbi:FAD-binding oxidoreductase [Aerosakkonemataceae cyanobacterium BLCC-F154]|uniref:FAD-binding oxidoreductase n=1 Tax=Floridaenema fluviatile BLCC-F154 TaxID=3153640 RepID=A0ABV4Y6H8_9CYAN